MKRDFHDFLYMMAFLLPFLGFGLGIAFIYRPMPVSALDAPALCDLVDATSHGVAQTWDDGRSAYPNTPPDLYYLETLYIDDPRTTEPEDQSAYLLFYSQQTGELWIFPMWSMAAPDNSNPPGSTCAPRKYQLEVQAG